MTCKQGFWMETMGFLERAQETVCESEAARARARVCGEHPRVERSELAQTLASSLAHGGIMWHCEFRPTGNGRPANNPTALARSLKNEQCCLQVTQNLLFSCAGACGFYLQQPLYAPSTHISQIYSVTYSNLLSSAA